MSVGGVLEREHRIIDVGITIFAGAEPDEVTASQRMALLDAIAMLRRHIYLEEEYLFPPLRAAGLLGPVMVMLIEHGKMWPVLDELERLLGDGEFAATAELCRNLLEQLAAHNLKEERILYPQAEDLLTAGDLDELNELLASAEMPSGWSCSGVAVD